MYGSSLNLEKSQSNEISTQNSVKLEITHEFPVELSEKAEKIKRKIMEKKLITI